MAVTEAPSLELRCPSGPRGLFAKLIPVSDARVDAQTNLIEFACQWCRKHSDEPAALVLHRYNFLGELVETVVVPSDT